MLYWRPKTLNNPWYIFKKKKPAIAIILLGFSVQWTIFYCGLDAGLEGKRQAAPSGLSSENLSASVSPRVKFFQTTPATF